MPFIGAVACARADTATADTATADTRDAIATAGTVTASIAADTDDFGAPLPTDARFAARVVSLNPAATEAIFTIGADSLLVGRSRWDEYPKDVERIASLGDGIRPNIEAVLAARPTLVVLYATAENRAAADALARAGVRTIALRVDRIAQFYRMLTVLGRAMGADARAKIVTDSVHATLDRVKALTASRPRRRVVWPAWESPLLVIGGGSYIDELLSIAGADNVFHDMSAPSPPVSIEEIAKRDPDVVIAGVTRAATLTASPSWQAVRAVRERRFIVQDPAVTGRPSVVLGMAAVQLARALHPELRDSLP
ncbi:ABC transporter substrate-binding protein [Gemmatimonas sp.]|uniref:ABC transporter substrate-binding protein n=1 Tax=Gemmatimonas sp. TaxID=1962908 RepID=UPI0035633655